MKKFRAWDVNDEEMVYDIVIDTKSQTWATESWSNGALWYEIDKFPIMQSTGRLDEKGEEIYVDDLFGKLGGDTETPNEYEIHAQVYFDDDLLAFCVEKSNGGWEYLADYLLDPKSEKVVIGNIWETPELLNKDKQS